MKHKRSVLLVLLAAASLCSTASPRSDLKTFRGAWFTARYPRDFKPRAGLPGRTTAREGCDSAFFTSPDKAVEFYIYSPQWNGTPTDYLFDPKREVLVASRQVRKRGGSRRDEDVRIRWVTVRAKDHGYTRSWVDTENIDLRTRLVLGIKYRDRASYRKYLAKYRAFKSSIEQFAD